MISNKEKKLHLSKGTSDFKQNKTHENPPHSGSVFHTRSPTVGSLTIKTQLLIKSISLAVSWILTIQKVVSGANPHCIRGHENLCPKLVSFLMFHFDWGHLCLWNDVANWKILSVVCMYTWHIVQDQVVEVTVWTWEVFWEPVEVWHALPVDAVGEVEVGQMGQGPKHQLKIVGPTHHHVPHAQALHNNRSGHYLN